jgi:excisionase family DNA binding protein
VKREPAEKSLLITQRDAASMIGVSTTELLRWVRNTSIKFVVPVRVVNHTYLFNRAEVEEWVRMKNDRAGPPRLERIRPGRAIDHRSSQVWLDTGILPRPGACVAPSREILWPSVLLIRLAVE